MILHPGILALLVGSLTVAAMALYSAWFGVRLLRSWDLSSGSEAQILLERRTYLVSTMMAYAFGFEMISLFLLIFTAEDLQRLFVGAMCAAGTFNVNGWGYPALLLKILTVLLAGLWLVVNHADSRGFDYPLIRGKYALLAAMAPVIAAEAFCTVAWFSGLKANVITSCCGSLFSADSQGVASTVASVPAAPAAIAFYGMLAATVAAGVYFVKRGGGAGIVFSALSLASLVVSAIALISLFSLYFYALPTHHCPFCLLQAEYHYVGYLLYVALLAGAITGTGGGLFSAIRLPASLEAWLPGYQKRLTTMSLLFYVLFAAVVTAGMMSSDLIMEYFQP
ncbi:MAG: hypothetical protein ACM34C_00520 [Syntrophaceae bacterium]